jgi:hypothetical protein
LIFILDLLSSGTYIFSSSAYTKALDDAIAVLDKIAMPVDVNDRKFTVKYIFPGSGHFTNGTFVL